MKAPYQSDGTTTRQYGLCKLRETLEVYPAVSNVMKGNRSIDTRPERKLRLLLFHQGYRGYRCNVRGLPGTPDIVYSRSRLCVFVHGCFWHSCPKCQEGKQFNVNRRYWQAKLARNVERDERQLDSLRSLGWTVIVVWECELRDDPSACLARIASAIHPSSVPAACASEESPSDRCVRRSTESCDPSSGSRGAPPPGRLPAPSGTPRSGSGAPRPTPSPRAGGLRG